MFHFCLQLPIFFKIRICLNMEDSAYAQNHPWDMRLLWVRSIVSIFGVGVIFLPIDIAMTIVNAAAYCLRCRGQYSGSVGYKEL